MKSEAKTLEEIENKLCDIYHTYDGEEMKIFSLIVYRAYNYMNDKTSKKKSVNKIIDESLEVYLENR